MKNIITIDLSDISETTAEIVKNTLKDKIEDVKGAIQNEKLWLMGASTEEEIYNHTSNIEVQEEYHKILLKTLNEFDNQKSDIALKQLNQPGYGPDEKMKNDSENFKEDIVKSLIKISITINDDEKFEGAMMLASEILNVSIDEVAEMIYDGGECEGKYKVESEVNADGDSD